MRKLLLLLFAAILIGCNAPDKKVLSDDEIKLRERTQNDSLLIVFDSLMQKQINLPPLIDSSIISMECLNEFDRLAKETGGEIKVIATAKYITRSIVDIIENHSKDNCDIMIVMDKTGSMEDDFANVEKGFDQILKSIEKFENVRLSMATYGDKNVDAKDWYDYKNFEKDFDAARTFIHNIELSGGGDYEESVYDGIYKAFEENFWQSDSKRIVLLIGDAPSLDSTLTDHTLEDILTISKRDRINMNFYPVVISPNYYSELEEDVYEKHMEEIKLIENIYPNPTTGAFSISFDTPNIDDLTLEIIDQKSNTILSTKVTSNPTRVDLYDYPNGLYVIRVFDKNKNYDVKKIILSK